MADRSVQNQPRDPAQKPDREGDEAEATTNDQGRAEARASATEEQVGRQGVASRNRGAGLERSDEELQRSSESGVSGDAALRRAADGVDPATGRVRDGGKR